MMRVQMPRTIYSQGRVTLVYLILGVVTAGAVFGGVTDLLLHRIVVSRIERLTRNVAAIGIGRHFSARVALPGNDELSTLATSINGTLRLSGAGRGSSGVHQRGARRTYTGEDR
jgi:adenylate cyclase